MLVKKTSKKDEKPSNRESLEDIYKKFWKILKEYNDRVELLEL